MSWQRRHRAVASAASCDQRGAGGSARVGGAKQHSATCGEICIHAVSNTIQTMERTGQLCGHEVRAEDRTHLPIKENRQTQTLFIGTRFMHLPFMHLLFYTNAPSRLG